MDIFRTTYLDPLYEYLHDQGMEFHIEPSSASGEPDLISDQTGDERLVADAKLFKGRADKGKIVKGFRQIYDYTKDYNEPFGYLVVFKTCEEDLAFPTAEQEQSTPFLVHNNKTVFLLVIDIHLYDKTASQRGRPEVVEITEADLVKDADAGERSAPPDGQPYSDNDSTAGAGTVK